MTRRRSSKRTRLKTQPKASAAWLRVPIVPPKGQRLRALVYARYSTDEQNRRSVQDQIRYCKEFLKAARVARAEITVLSDEGLSGELASRPSINKVWEGVRAGDWHLIVSEDASRLYSTTWSIALPTNRRSADM